MQYRGDPRRFQGFRFFSATVSDASGQEHPKEDDLPRKSPRRAKDRYLSADGRSVGATRDMRAAHAM